MVVLVLLRFDRTGRREQSECCGDGPRPMAQPDRKCGGPEV